jgi:hypothetical protein
VLKSGSTWLFGLKNKPKYVYLVLIAITLVAAMLRFYKLGEWSFWGDEMFTVGGREDGFNYTIIRQSVSLALIQTTIGFFGPSEWYARLVPALIGVISVPILYFPIKKIFDPPVALMSALLLAVSTWHIYWSQNARFYVALLLFYTLALLTFYIGLEEDRPWYLLASLVLMSLATKERLLGLFIIPVLLGYLALLKFLPFDKPAGLTWRNLALYFGPILIFGSFFVFPYVKDVPGWLDAGFGYVNNNPVWILAGVVYYVGLPIVCVGTFGAFYLLVNKNRAALLLSLSAVLPLAIMMGLSLVHYTANRYVFTSLTGWIILASAAAVELIRQTHKSVKILAVGLAVLLLFQPLSEDLLYFRYQNGNRDNWKAAFEWVKIQKQAGDLVVAANTELGDFYMRDQTIDFRDLDLAGIEAGGRRAWFVEDMVAEEVFPEVHHWLRENAQLVANFDVRAQARNFSMRVYVYESSGSLSENNRRWGTP